MDYALDQFTMHNTQLFVVQGSHSLFTYQNIGTNTATIQGSNDASTWSDIASLASGASLVKEHSYKYLRCLGDTQVSVNRGEGDNTIGGGSSGGAASYPNFTGNADKVLTVNATEDDVEWTTVSSGGVALGETSSTAYRGDNGKIAYDHSQSQGNPHNTTTSDISEGTKLFFTEPRVRQTVLTGLNTSTATPALATDQLLAAIGKLQAQINNIAPPTWVSAASIGTTHSSFVNVQFAKINGLLWIRGYCNNVTAVGAGTTLFLLTNPSYHLDIPATFIFPAILGEIKTFVVDPVGSKLIQLKNVVNNANKFTLSNPVNFAANEYSQIQPVALGRLLTP